MSAGLPGPGSADFAYDGAGRLTEASPLDFAYDTADNPTQLGATSALTYDDAGQLETSTSTGGQTTYDFSAAGERTATTPPAGPATSYAYDAAGQLNSVARSGSPTVTYGYDGDGLRTDRAVGSTDTEFVWDKTGDLPLLLTEDDTSYIYGPDGLPLQSIDASNTVRYFHHDRLGSTRQITNEAGDVVAAQSYGAYGNITDTTGSARIPFGFAGEYWDEHSSLLYLRARHYDPATGQFLNRDPLESVSGQPYLYAGGDPVNAVDPEGLLFGITRPTLRQVSNAVAGFGDSASFGLTSKIRKAIGQDHVDYCSGAYAAGQKTDEVLATASGIRGAARGALHARKSLKTTKQGDSIPVSRFAQAGESGYSPTRIGKVAQQTGRTPKEIRDAIHELKDDMTKGGGARRNPDVHIDETGEVYPLGPGGTLGDSLGNIHDVLT